MLAREPTRELLVVLATTTRKLVVQHHYCHQHWQQVDNTFEILVVAAGSCMDCHLHLHLGHTAVVVHSVVVVVVVVVVHTDCVLPWHRDCILEEHHIQDVAVVAVAFVVAGKDLDHASGVGTLLLLLVVAVVEVVLAVAVVVLPVVK